eukprot:GHVS01058347.1.p1 GENE.GHVS01058347.1~~GHVS01058347.1.p1  ORF type:complete len:138 (-),score=27.02 GHVS01058347.1:54-467(-)
MHSFQLTFLSVPTLSSFSSFALFTAVLFLLQQCTTSATQLPGNYFPSCSKTEQRAIEVGGHQQWWEEEDTCVDWGGISQELASFGETGGGGTAKLAGGNMRFVCYDVKVGEGFNVRGEHVCGRTKIVDSLVLQGNST